jgi:hypothetical protein
MVTIKTFKQQIKQTDKLTASFSKSLFTTVCCLEQSEIPLLAFLASFSRQRGVFYGIKQEKALSGR